MSGTGAPVPGSRGPKGSLRAGADRAVRTRAVRGAGDGLDVVVVVATDRDLPAVPSGPADTADAVPSGPVDTADAVPSGPVDTADAVPSGPVDTADAVPSGPADTPDAAPSGPADTPDAAPSGPADTARRGHDRRRTGRARAAG
ncbi:hypothetical protein [Streptomyces sp. NPDC088744]|uniref:hypothetical protein n=1 Tax=Streptomyces sp. NPDC088744 TaxID=3155061 RepID=UPI00344E5D3C